ncbi:MAG: hypothetical protein RSE38_00780 [Acinetobacter sp.]
MNVIEFVKECGIDVAKRILNNAIGFGCAEIELFAGKYVFRTDDLKQIVDAFELVERFGGISFAKNKIKGKSDFDLTAMEGYLKRAINLVEQCQ